MLPQVPRMAHIQNVGPRRLPRPHGVTSLVQDPTGELGGVVLDDVVFSSALNWTGAVLSVGI